MAGERILIVEDDRGTARLHTIAMRSLGLEVAVAYTEEEAYAKLDDKPDLVATDIHLDENDHSKKHGYAIARKALDQGAVVVIQSASASPSDHVQGVEIIGKFELKSWVTKKLNIS